MLKTFNYTSRKKIYQNEVLFSLLGPEDSPSFNVEFKFNERGFSKESVLYVEAYYKETRQRYNFGKISAIVHPKNRSITEVDLSGLILFRVIIVDETESRGRLLASGERFCANSDNKEEKGKSSLIGIVQRPMGQVPWRVDIEAESAPVLCLNKNIPNVIYKIEYDPYFRALVLPAVLREILVRFLWNEVGAENETMEKWMGFAQEFAEEELDSEDIEHLTAWVDGVVDAFSKKAPLIDCLLKEVEKS